MSLVNEETIAHLYGLAKKRRNVLLTSKHGAGKSTIIFSIRKKLKLKAKYFNGATLDPLLELVGLPVPSSDKKSITFLRMKDFMEAQWIIIDEINRACNPKVENALQEMLQFKTVNGVSLPNLEMVWAMQNPATKHYKVSQLDPALVTKFHARITLEANPSEDYLVEQGIKQEVAEALVEWWKTLKEDDRDLVPPRTLEYLGLLIKDDLDWRFCLGDDLGVNLHGLQMLLSDKCGISRYGDVKLRHMANDLDTYCELAAKDIDFASHVIREVESAQAITAWNVADVIVELPMEFQNRLFTDAAWVKKMLLRFPKLPKDFHQDDAVQKLHSKLSTVIGTGVGGLNNE